jgi:protein TonB
VIRSLPMLDEAALAAAREWEFAPTLVDGKPVPVLLMLELEFNVK